MIQMKVIFGVQKVLEIVNSGLEELPANPIDAQQNAYREDKKKACKGLFVIHQCVDANVLEKIAEETSTKATWDTLVKVL